MFSWLSDNQGLDFCIFILGQQQFMKKASRTQSKECLRPDPKEKIIKSRAEINQSNKYNQEFSSQSNIYRQPHTTHSQVKILQYPSANLTRHHDSHNYSRQLYAPSLSKPKLHPDHLQQTVPMLKERLKNIHEHYQAMIQQQKNKNSERSEVIMGLLEEMQLNHEDKIAHFHKMIQQSDSQKRDVGFVDEKMNEIKGNIDQLINQSNTFKIKNDEISKKIQEKIKSNQEKEKELDELSADMLQARNEVEQFEISNLRNNKINREIMEIFNSASTIASD